MNQETKKQVLSVLSEVIKILEVKEIRDVLELRKLSDKTLDDAIIFKDQDAIFVGVLIYALAKISQREFYNHKEYQELLNHLKQAYHSLQKDDLDNYRIIIKSIFEKIRKVDFKLKYYIEEILNKAKINKGSKLFEKGVSAGYVADMMGISQWELMNYVGKTRISDFEVYGVQVDVRLKLVRQLFK